MLRISWVAVSSSSITSWSRSVTPSSRVLRPRMLARVKADAEQVADDSVVQFCRDAFVVVEREPCLCGRFEVALFAYVSDDDDGREAVVRRDGAETDLDRKLRAVGVTSEQLESGAHWSQRGSGRVAGHGVPHAPVATAAGARFRPARR